MGRTAIIILVCIGLAGCASRRCCNCKCKCKQQPAMVPIKQASEVEPPAFAKISDAPSTQDSSSDSKQQTDLVEEDEQPAIAPQILSEPTKKPATKTKPVKLTKTPAATKIDSRPVQPALPQFVLPIQRDQKTDSSVGYGHAKDYSWLKGRLHRVHVPGVEWKIRYQPLDQADQWGGSMVLAPNIRLEDFEHLDAVYIEGKQLEARPSLYISGPLYRIESIRAQQQPSSGNANK